MRQRGSTARGPSQRQLRVGEELRHILSSIIMRNDWPAGDIPQPVTISQVDISPDLQNALIFVMPLGGEKREESLNFLIDMIPYLRKQLASSIVLRRVPYLKFVLDDTFDHADHMNRVFASLIPAKNSDTSDAAS